MDPIKVAVEYLMPIENINHQDREVSHNQIIFSFKNDLFESLEDDRETQE